MLHHSPHQHLYKMLSRTKLGAEALMKTRNDMKRLDRGSNIVVRFLARRRPIDFLALEVDGRMARELHPSFRIVKSICTFILMAPLFGLLVTGVISPTYYMLVPTGLLSEKRYEEMWKFSHWAVTLAGQLLVFVLFYDLSVYIRYPFFAYGLAPMFRWLELVRTPRKGFKTNHALVNVRRGPRPRPRPLGAPLGGANKRK
uniref:Uncharacterized protein n=1 Tax=Trypanosoma vivax (strain Y486) TaxID=1055687 RepID=G0TTM8_TRYVY|nr:conserved hypothetical protein [Trypanosoma vivax Y486]